MHHHQIVFSSSLAGQSFYALSLFCLCLKGWFQEQNQPLCELRRLPLYLLSKDSFSGEVPVLPKIETFAGVFDGRIPGRADFKDICGILQGKNRKGTKKDYIPGITELLKAFHQHDRPPKGINKKVAIASA